MLQTLTFNGWRQINALGSYFRYESGAAVGADSSIRVRADGQDLGLFLPGDDVQLPVELALWEITPVTPTCRGTVRLGVGKISSARLVGTVRVVEELNSNIQTTGGNSALTDTASLWQSTALVLPSENVRGLVVRSAILSVQAGSGGLIYARIAASPNTPSTAAGGNLATLISTSSFGGYSEASDHKINKRIPPNWGVYHMWFIGAPSALTNGFSLGTELE